MILEKELIEIIEQHRLDCINIRNDFTKGSYPSLEKTIINKLEKDYDIKRKEKEK